MIKLSNIIAPSFFNAYSDIKQNKYAHYWFKGGRGSTKSSFVAIMIILGMMKDKDANAIALRRYEKYCKDSVYEQLVWAIEALGVAEQWELKVSPLSITYKATGQKILFRGADKPKKIKSTKFRRGYCKYIWFEELDEFDGAEPVRIITQSLMRGGNDSTVFCTYNPPQTIASWVNAESLCTRESRFVHHSTYLDVSVEWLGKQFIAEAEHLKATNIKAYEHEYLGKVVGTGGEIFNNVVVRKITDAEIGEFETIRRGMDFGYAIDPLAYVVCDYNRKKKTLHIFSEVYKVNMSNSEAYAVISKENINNEAVICDSSEPRTINELRQYGLSLRPAKKGPDSVDFGIKFLQSLEAIIIDDTRCPNTSREFLQYEHEKDSQGNFKAGYPDKNNHSIDAVRYALNFECLKFRDEIKNKKDPNKLSPEEKHQKMVRDVTGGSVPDGFFSW